MTNRLQDKVALISGTGSGIGRAAALRFAAEGAHVVGCDLNTSAAEETVQLVREAGGTMISLAPVDLGDEGDVARWIDAAIAEYGRIDILYNNAGAFTASTFADSTADGWRQSVRNEVDVVYFPTRAVWQHMIDGGGGSIICTGSVTAHRSNSTRLYAHGVGKGAVASFAPHLAIEGGPHGIRINTLSPGLTQTNQTTGLITDKDVERTPLRRIGRPEDIAAVALFLASDDAAYVTGADYVVDGGQSILLPANR